MRRGFTLIELLIVIVIIGILAVGFAPSLLSAPKKARDAVRKGQMASIKGAIEAYALDNGSAYPSKSAALTCLTTPTGVSDDGKSIQANFQGSTLPKDPSYTGDKTDTCGISYKYIAADKCYILSTKLEVAGSGNSKAADPVCATTVADSEKGDYYQMIVKY